MKVYAVRDIAGYKKGDEVQVFHVKEIDWNTWFMIWSKKLKKWGFTRLRTSPRTRFGWRRAQMDKIEITRAEDGGVDFYVNKEIMMSDAVNLLCTALIGLLAENVVVGKLEERKAVKALYSIADGFPKHVEQMRKKMEDERNETDQTLPVLRE